VRAAFEAWLAPGNFGAEGRQRKSLVEIRDPMKSGQTGVV
jgi:hypothetical protein